MGNYWRLVQQAADSIATAKKLALKAQADGDADEVKAQLGTIQDGADIINAIARAQDKASEKVAAKLEARIAAYLKSIR